MARRSGRERLEEALARLKRAREDPRSDGARHELREAIGRGGSLVCAKAARVVEEAEIPELTEALQGAFQRFMADPIRSDPGCAAKTAIVRALTKLAEGEPRIFLHGIRHVQMEPVFGGQADTAVDLRGASGFGLVAIGYPDALPELARLLADAEAPARVAGARAVAALGRAEGVPLLRLRALLHDAEPRVTSECLLGLLRLAPQASLAFVRELLLGGAPHVAEAAALALGESRLPEAFPLLQGFAAASTSAELRRTAFLALAALRRDEALAWLLEQLREGTTGVAIDAVLALAVHRADAALAERVRTAVQEREEPIVRRTFQDAFGR